MYLAEELSHVRAGRANVAILDGVRVNSYGSMVPLNQVATVTTPDARTIAIRPWDKKAIKDIEKAIMDSGVGITPENNGEIVRLGIPQPTGERRKELVKQCNKIAERAKIEVRNVRQEIKEKLKKAIEENVGIDYGRAKTYTVGNWLEVWYENYAKIKMRPSTYLTYHGYIENHIKPQLGKIPLNDLTTLHLQQFYKKLLAEGRVERIEAQKQPKGLSAKTVRDIHQIISSALKLAVEQRLIAHNPADGCALPKAERKSDLILSSIPLIESIFVALEIQPFDFRYS